MSVARVCAGLSKRLLFVALPWLVLALGLEGLLALVGLDALATDDDPYAGFAESIPLFVATKDSKGRARYETSPRKQRFFNQQSFAAEKPPAAARLFCIGGSTTYGRPFEDSTSFCGWLRELLARTDVERQWEVVNAGGVSYASYRAAAVMRELREYSPDVFVIYSGHNEFLERRTWSGVRALPRWIRELDVLMRRTRTYALAQRAAALVTRGEADAIPAEVDALLDTSVGLEAYTRDEPLRRRVLAEYQENLRQMVAIARGAGAVPVLVVPASNLRDCSPFKSEFDAQLGDHARRRWRKHFDAGRGALDAGRTRAGREELARAVEIDPLRADGHYWLGRALLEAGEDELAQAHLHRAREQDVCPLRALDPMADAVRAVASAEQVALVDYPKLLAARSSGPFGAEQFVDHVHPTIEAHGWLASAIVDTLHQRGRVARATRPSDFAQVETKIREGLDPQRRGLALRNLAKVLSWAGKTEDAARSARAALALLGQDAECEFILGGFESAHARYAAAIDHYDAALELEPDYTKARNNLGIALAREGRLDAAIEAYSEVLRLQPEHVGARFNRANALLRVGRLDQSILAYRGLLEGDWDDLDAHYNLARAYARRGDLEPAERHFEIVVAADPDATDAREQLASLLAGPRAPSAP